MAYGFGYNGYFGLAKESTWGTYVPATKFDRIDSESVQQKVGRIPIVGIQNSRLPAVLLAGEVSADGPVKLPVNADGVVGYLLKDVFPAEATSNPGAGAAWQHVFTPPAAGLGGMGFPGL